MRLIRGSKEKVSLVEVLFFVFSVYLIKINLQQFRLVILTQVLRAFNFFFLPYLYWLLNNVKTFDQEIKIIIQHSVLTRYFKSEPQKVQPFQNRSQMLFYLSHQIRQQLMKLIIFLTLIWISTNQGWVLWKQCDPHWANEQLGFGVNTVCSAGCLMTSVAMAITMMVGLKQSFYNKPHLYYVHFVMANVNQGRHWVLVTGYFNDYVTVNDPGFNRDTYPLNQIVRYGWYQRLRLPINIESSLSNAEQLQNIRKDWSNSLLLEQLVK